MERFIQTLQRECLDYFIVFGEEHMNYLVSEMVAYYHEERPRQAKENGRWCQQYQTRHRRKTVAGRGPHNRRTLYRFQTSSANRGWVDC